MSNAKYLRITIHDNDFSSSLIHIGKLIYEIFQFENEYPTEEHFPYLKEYIKHLWWSTHSTFNLMSFGLEYVKDRNYCDLNYFEPTLEFVDYLDIPDWDNGESIYIPMFDNAEILPR